MQQAQLHFVVISNVYLGPLPVYIHYRHASVRIGIKSQAPVFASW